MHRWARGESLSAVLTAAEQNGVDLSAGDFVRWCRQVLDLLDQIADVAGRDTPSVSVAATAARSVRAGSWRPATVLSARRPDPPGCPWTGRPAQTCRVPGGSPRGAAVAWTRGA
jgi:hypothetical protein